MGNIFVFSAISKNCKCYFLKKMFQIGGKKISPMGSEGQGGKGTGTWGGNSSGSGVGSFTQDALGRG